jgi:hypothetical protein
MRTHRQLVLYQSILQVLEDSGCPFCRFLKEYQTARLQNRPQESIHRLCSFHTWGLAAVRDAPAAAQVFIKLVEDPPSLSPTESECDVCEDVLAEEDLRLREFVSCIARTDVSHWLRGSAVLCIPHGTKLRRLVQPAFAARIDAIIQNCRQQLAQELQHLRDDPEPDRTGWGAIGRAAEFLVSQRGLHT